MKKILLVFLFICQNSHAFVSGPGSIDVNENFISLSSQVERGKIEPNENKASFQSAQMDIYKLRYVRGLRNFLGMNHLNVYIEYGEFSSNKEQVGTTLFYERNLGSFLTVGASGDIVHDLEKQFGIYLQATPIRNYNKDKFSNPRLDVFAFGVTTTAKLTNNFFQKNLIHIGAGDKPNQNSYLAIDTGFGYKLDELANRQLSLSASLFLEADTVERKDERYDAAFSPSGTQDRVRAFKYGTLLGLDMAISKKINLKINYLQKLGGYDARSTQIYTMNLGYKF